MFSRFAAIFSHIMTNMGHLVVLKVPLESENLCALRIQESAPTHAVPGFYTHNCTMQKIALLLQRTH